MSEITKLYENAGIKPTKNWQSCLNCKLKTEIRHDEWGEEYLTCKRLERPEECFDAKEYYPIFTTEKQLELIKFLMKQEDFSWTIAQQGKDTKYVFYVGYEYGSGDFKEFTEAIAGIINNLWQDLTEKEKQQVKGILK